MLMAKNHPEHGNRSYSVENVQGVRLIREHFEGVSEGEVGVWRHERKKYCHDTESQEQKECEEEDPVVGVFIRGKAIVDLDYLIVFFQLFEDFVEE